jgi:hypothetical protein
MRALMALVAVSAAASFFWLRSIDQVPEGWEPSEFRAAVARAVDPDRRARVEVEMLAWSTQEDDRPHRFDSALAWARIETREEVRWALIEMYRHPLERPQWYVSGTDHGPTPLRYYVNPPRNLEVHAFVDALHLSDFFGTEPHFRRLAAAVRRLTWRITIGENPTRCFK